MAAFPHSADHVAIILFLARHVTGNIHQLNPRPDCGGAQLYMVSHCQTG